MNYYQGVVVEYLRADRSVFVNTECCIQLNPGDNPDGSGPHWYCDALAVDLRGPAVYLCETSYSKSLDALLTPLSEWNTHWPQVRASIARDCRIPDDWPVRPWLFIPQERIDRAVAGIQRIGNGPGQVRLLPDPRITTLEMVAWNYRSWNRQGERIKPDTIPQSMQM